MSTFTKLNITRNILFLFLLFLCISQTKSQSVYPIAQEVTGFPEYRKAEFSKESTGLYYFKYDISYMPKSKVMAFRFVFDQFDQTFKDTKIICTSLDTSISDDNLKAQLDNLDPSNSSCIGDFNEEYDLGIYDGIMKLDITNTKIGIRMQVSSNANFIARIFLRISEEILETKQQLKSLDQTHSLVPSTLIISDFRQLASKILFYSLTRELQMYYVESDVAYPEKLFSGNVLLIYTNPNQVRQKYKNANTMILLSRPFSKSEPTSEQFNFQVKFFDSQYLLDYFVSNNPLGRSKNTPLMINMNKCTEPYYVVLNYNQKEKNTSLYIDQVYGKVNKLSVATSFNNYIKWDDMIENMEEIRAQDRYYELPPNIETHIDIYKVECQVPLLLNFYFVDEKASKADLDYGHVAIINLKPSETVQLPFASTVFEPILSIEVFNPIKLPSVIINDGDGEEKLITKKMLIKSTPKTIINPLIIKERNGDSNTRVIVKVGYNIAGRDWERLPEPQENIYYNKKLNLFVFAFPNEQDRFNYTDVDLVTKGKKEEDNIKYCFSTSIGTPILPSAENCYRVSLNNPYTLKFLSPLIMHRDYDFADDIGYFISIKPLELTDDMDITDSLHTYNTSKRNFEGLSNVIEIDETGSAKTILTSPINKDDKIFIQVAQCTKKDIKIKVVDAYMKEKDILNETDIKSDKKNYYAIVDNELLETELTALGEKGTKVFIRHSGLRDRYVLQIIDNPSIDFNTSTNEIILERPVNASEAIEYVVYVGKEGEFNDKDITLCSIAENELISSYSKSTISYGTKAKISINFEKIGLKANDKFEALVYYELKYNTKMAFLSPIFKGVVGDVKIDVVTEINQEYEQDNNILYAQGKTTSDGGSLYFSYMPEEIRDVPVGAFRIEFNNENTKSLSVYCAFVNENETQSGMIEAFEDPLVIGSPYCIGGKNINNGKYFNYLVRYSYTEDKQPKKLVIKIVNNQNIDDGFNIYLRKGNNTYITPTNFEEQKEYGQNEENEKTIIPYIINLESIRGDDTKENYISKLLIYSRYLNLQMFYIDETEKTHMPMILFTGGIMLIYTKPELAIQKYHTTKLILLSENLNGQEHSELGDSFRFHTKMFNSTAQIEFFMSNNPTGRTLNYPLSLEINTCNEFNKKYYYILNYNRLEDDRILYLDLIYGLMKSAHVVTKIESDHWDELIENGMQEIKDMQITLGNNTQHIDVVEIECSTPLLANAFYNKPNEEYLQLTKGKIAIKTIPGKEQISIGIDPLLSGGEFVSISLYNINNDADCNINYGTTSSERMIGNSAKITLLKENPQTISITNNDPSSTRVIVKLGYGVESTWKKENISNIRGELYSNENKYVYKFPYEEDKLNYTNVEFLVKPMKKDSEPEAANIKFCYSSSLGMAIDASRENCFRTGAKIPYTLNFVNPLIAPKTYNTIIDTYYVTFSPYEYSNYISLNINENKYSIEKRGVEGMHSSLTLTGEQIKDGILLSIPSQSYCNKIFVQLQACVAKNANINYKTINSFSKEVIKTGVININEKVVHYELDNNKMETEIDFIGEPDDKVFVKHMGITDTKLELEAYSSTWVENKNSVSIIKPIKNNEDFEITVIVGKTGSLDKYSLCTFAEISRDKYNTLGDYVATFTSTTSDIVTHFIDFSNMEGYDIGTEFDLLVYAVQINKMKIEILYDIIKGKVGKIEGIEEINGIIPEKKDYVTHLFSKDIISNNYLYYDFKSEPIGDIASLKIISNQGEPITVSKVSCALVKSSATNEEMVKAVNEAERTYNNLCVSKTYKDNGFDSLINIKDYTNGNTKLVILVKYGMSLDNNNNEETIMNITLRTTGFKITKEDSFNEDETLTIVPYVLDLKEIREMEKENYHSKVLIYSNSREMDMYYLQNASPSLLFSGNIMLVYTNEDVIKEKYNGASTMILLVDSFSKKNMPLFGEKFKFKIFFYDSKKLIQYYLSANPNGRPLNNPTSIEMLNCDQPYYYILNYHLTEGDKMLHIDTIFGEINSTKFADQLNSDDWDSFISEMKEFNGDELLIKRQVKYHIDVFEVKCNTPLLINVYYSEPKYPNKYNLKQGDISILTLNPNTKESLSLLNNLNGQRFFYSFNVRKKNGTTPNILIEYDDKDSQAIQQNGLFIQNTTDNYHSIAISNKELQGEDTTRVIFKFGYNIDENFTKIENDIYNLQTPDRKDNLFAYRFKKGEDRLNYTKIDFEVKTEYENVKFCYVTNLGAFINPSTQNCFRVGEKNSYTISVINPYIMYKNYYIGNEVLDYFVSFKTESPDLNITIIPKLYKYDTTYRNMPEIPNKIIIKDTEKTILTNPENKEYLFVQMDVCTSNNTVRYEFKNAYDGESLGEKGEISPSSKNIYKNILNTKLDTELLINTEDKDKDVNMFIKHTGVKDKFEPSINKIEINYVNKKLNFTQPIKDEVFNYTIFIDQKDNIRNQGYTLCSFTIPGKKALYTTQITSSAKEIIFNLDFDKIPELKEYDQLDLLILAEELNNGKMMFLSDIYVLSSDSGDTDSDPEPDTDPEPKTDSDGPSDGTGSGKKTTVIVVAVVVPVVCIAAGIIIFILIRRKNRTKASDIDYVKDGETGQKLVESESIE